MWELRRDTGMHVSTTCSFCSSVTVRFSNGKVISATLRFFHQNKCYIIGNNSKIKKKDFAIIVWYILKFTAFYNFVKSYRIFGSKTFTTNKRIYKHKLRCKTWTCMLSETIVIQYKWKLTRNYSAKIKSEILTSFWVYKGNSNI